MFEKGSFGQMPIAQPPKMGSFGQHTHTKMKKLQAELTDLLKQEEESKKDLLQVFKELGYEIKL